MAHGEVQDFWDGTQWQRGETMQVPEAGRTRLHSVPTTSGWRVELGDPTYPIRYWDGTEAVFTVDDSGDIVARSITLYPTTSATAGAVTVDASSAGTGSVHAFSFIGITSEEQFYIRATGELRINNNVEVYGNLSTDTEPTIRMVPGGFIEMGAGGSTAPDILLYRNAANVLALNTGDSLAWTGAATSRLDSSGYVQMAEIAAPATPAANQVRLYAKDSAGVSRLFYKDDAGVEHGPL